jgi:hypothetical protein
LKCQEILHHCLEFLDISIINRVHEDTGEREIQKSRP